MANGLELAPNERDALRAAINAFEWPARSRGEQYCRRGAVRDVWPRELTDEEPGVAGFEAHVLGSQTYQVTWIHEPRVGWACSCTCPVGIDCKHAYAAARHLLDLQGSGPITAADATCASPAGISGPAAELIALLEQRHGRPLTKAETGFVRKLEQLWMRHRSHGTIYAQELADVSLADRSAGLFYDPNPAIRGEWEQPLTSPLELWQHLAFYAERANRPLPPLMKPVTDTASVRARIEERERKRHIAHWTQLFSQPPRPPGTGAPDVAIPEVRLRLASPKLIWEYRSGPNEPWRAAKGGMVQQWFAALENSPASVPPATLAILQEVQLRRYRPNPHGYYGWKTGAEPQTLKLDDESTGDLVAWMLASDSLRAAFVNNQGEAYDAERVALVWTARRAPGRPDDVEFAVTLADGSAVPRDLVELAGRSRLGLHGRSVYQFPPYVPGVPTSGAVIPREALAAVSAVRHLRRAGVVAPADLELPRVEVVTLAPCFRCELADEGAEGSGRGVSVLQVELLARSADGLVAKRWNGQAWTSMAGKGTSALPRAGNRIWDFDLGRADAVIPLLNELRLGWAGPSRAWTRAVTKSFPADFSNWAGTVRAAGADLECDPRLAGLVRPPDRGRFEIEVAASDEGGTGIDWFDLKLVLRAEDATLTEAEIALLLKARGGFVLLKGKGWRRLEVEIEDEQRARLEELGLDAEILEKGGGRQRFHALQLADERIAGLLPEEHAARARDRAASLRAVEPPAVPPGLSAELRPYQREGFHFLAHLASNRLGGLLADDMGLGKTVQALAWLLWLDGRRDVAARPLRVLVVCPKSVVTNWENEARRFAPSLSVAAYRARSELTDANLTVINYAQLRLAAGVLRPVEWDAVILDEGQNIKNPQSQTAQVARELRAMHRLVLTGTPIENRVLDLWSLFAFAMPGLLGGQTSFRRTYNDKTDPLARARLARRVRHFMLRRTKAQVAADLPPRIEEDLVVELEPAQRRLYDAEIKRARQMLLQAKTAREFDGLRFSILQSLLRLRQICCDPRLLGASTSPGDSAKVGALIDQLEPILQEGHKVLIFSQFVSMLQLLQPELTAREIRYLTITGQTENRQELVDRFQNSPDERVFLLSLKAAGAGLNLTAASYVVLFDPWWNPAVEAQAIDRTHRIGQASQVIAYRLLAKDTVEEKIRLLQKAKSELARAVVQEESLASVLNLEDLRYVLG